MPRLFLVDDEAVLLAALSRILAGAGYDVAAYSSGTEALAALSDPAATPPDLVITDVLMEGVDGLQLFAFARQSPVLQGIPFIFVSASAKPELERMIATSPNAIFMRKPFDMDLLLSRIAQAVEHRAG
jgi:CheY-like chemotaxis protein